ncbi:hypothetical protein BCR33DRAFT_721876 [Rhizoclosmatium globosum]|uniref:Uncharacterized protein n=1 Tax=Rhizoclosmatium globosum TaxID=329046 RepID=A0A1Y2BPJ1_9FUNG|nr:hypothetical protein BCR33DRAFT_721876 [Rhizoclosmatium globosum]|eukprot:ORY36661.1 hypothetical protein BCR33DRAFT_721876 [Rhizoclosmatium globosum]
MPGATFSKVTQFIEMSNLRKRIGKGKAGAASSSQSDEEILIKKKMTVTDKRKQEAINATLRGTSKITADKAPIFYSNLSFGAASRI